MFPVPFRFLAPVLCGALFSPAMARSEEKAPEPSAKGPAAQAAAGLGLGGEKDQELIDRVSLAFGTTIARDLTEDGIVLNLEKVTEAMRAIIEGKEPLANEEEIGQTFQDLRAFLNERGKRENAAFLEENLKREGVKATPSGLQYEVLQAAAGGAKPKAADQVKVHYTGKLIDGTVFDSSVERGEPITFGLGQVIGGWTEGLQLMSVGEKYRLTIPYNLAYGEQGSPPRIPGFSTLVFDIELIAINP